MYKVMVKQYFDTYFEWEIQYKEQVSTLKEAEELEEEANKKYVNRPLVSYQINIEEVI